MQTVSIRHNVEMGHRLSLQPDSKCFHVHGHTWWITVEIEGPPDPISGMIMNYTDIKAKLRPWLDENFDHHTLLNTADRLWGVHDPEELERWGFITYLETGMDPTVENFARLIYQQCKLFWPARFWRFKVTAQEGPVNAATYGDF